jgi:hypothetical protein
VWTLAESLGGVESLIEHPARMTHASTATGPFAAPPNLVRLSVGIESADDLVADLRARALAGDAGARAPARGARRTRHGRSRGQLGLATSRNAVPVGSCPVASRPYGVSCAARRPCRRARRPARAPRRRPRRRSRRSSRTALPASSMIPASASLALAERRVAELVRVAHRVRVPAEHVAVERDRVVVAPVCSSNHAGARLAGDLEPLHLVRLPRADGPSRPGPDHRELPFSATSIGAISTAPPCSRAAVGEAPRRRRS